MAWWEYLGWGCGLLFVFIYCYIVLDIVVKAFKD